MGSNAFKTYSRGNSAKEAYTSAVERAEDEYGHQEGYSGEINSSHGYKDMTDTWKNSGEDIDSFIERRLNQLSKFQPAECICFRPPVTNKNKIKTQVEHIVSPGTKKWILMYVVYDGDIRVTAAPTKTEAVKLARTYSEKHQCTTIVKMERRLEKNDHALVAKVKYKKAQNEKQGNYIFYGWASC